jgi:hypothetical protein
MRIRLTGLSALAVLNAGDALAQSPGYVGTWASNAKQCAIDQSMQGAPLILKRNGYDQHEAHCTFTSVTAAGADTWRVRARCSVEGDRQNHTLTLTVKGNRLTLRDERGARTMVRCG